MKKLIFTSPKYGDKEATTTAATLAEGTDTKALFTEIMEQGYGDDIPPVFLAEHEDGSASRHEGKDAAQKMLNDPTVKEAVVIAPLAGG
jgi:hypothetical protein